MTSRSTEVPAQVAVRPMLLRFDRVERAAHWANAVLFGALIVTALPLYFPGVEGLVGRRSLLAEIHLWAGVALPVLLIVSLLGPWGTRLRADIRRINLWSRGEIRWLRSIGRYRAVRLGKFNPGQKLNAIFTAATIAVMLASGLVMHFFNVFPVSWRTGATFVHDVFFFAAVVVIAGHIAFAFMHPSALRSMWRGTVSEAWAARHAPAWLDEEPEAVDPVTQLSWDDSPRLPERE